MTARRLSPSTLSAFLCSSVGLWISCGALAVAAMAAGAPRIGVLPSFWWLGAAAAGAVALALVVRPAPRRVAVLWLSALLFLPWLPRPAAPAQLVFTGHLREFVWLAIAVGLAAPFASRAVRGWRFVTDPRRAAWAAAAVAALVYLSAASSLWPRHLGTRADRKSTRLNSSHLGISYAVFCYVAPHHLLLVPTRRSSDLTFASSSGSRLPSDSPRRLPLARFADGASSPIRGAPPGPPRQWPRSCT